MENTIKQFCQAWSNNDFSKMYEVCTLTWKAQYDQKSLENLIIGRIKSFKIGHIEANSKFPCIGDIDIKIKHRRVLFPSLTKTKTIKARLIKESKPYKPSEEGTWGVNPISVIRNLYVKVK